MHFEIQNQIETLYQGDIPIDIIEDITSKAQEHGMSVELAAIM